MSSNLKRKIITESEKTTAKRIKNEVKKEISQCSSLDESSMFFEVEKGKHEILADVEGIDLNVSQNLIQLFDDDNTIPFIARYRRDKIGDLTPDRLRALKEAYDNLKQLRVKADKAITQLTKKGDIDPFLVARMKNVQSLEELDLLIAPFKEKSKGSFAARAKEAGLEQPGRELLYGISFIDCRALIDPNVPGRETLINVWTGIKHIIADIVAKDSGVLNHLQSLKTSERIFLQCSLKKKDSPEGDSGKYDLYKNFNQDISHVKPHQILAINRAESQKVLNVKVSIPQSFWNRLKEFCVRQWLGSGRQYDDRTKLCEEAMSDSFQRLLSPLATRQIRRNLTEEAERSSLTVFATNLKNLLLGAPLRGKVVMGIDPGLKHGCKIAVVSSNGQVLHTNKIFLLDDDGRSRAARLLKSLVNENRCETIVIGNGTFCRQTEEFLCGLIQDRYFEPFDISYTIIDEQGVSIYSCSPAAAEEFPGMEPNLISAVSLARRLQDPLAELVKVDPKHLGVGMYQHDVSEKKLSTTLDDVVSECVSFVGVDLNTASLDLLRRVAGLTKSRAEAIIAWRKENGPFQNRQQLGLVKGIGSKSFQQCAGFIRILLTTAKKNGTDVQKKTKKGKKASVEDKFNYFDMTEIHPEDYDIAKKIIAYIKVNEDEIGQSHVIQTVKSFLSESSVGLLSRTFKISTAKVKQILDALSKEVDHDLRGLSQKPLFRKEVTTIESLKLGSVLSGVVRNVTHFGAFVDIGVGTNALLHSSQLPHKKDLWVKLGDKIDVCVLNVDVKSKRIGLRLIRTRNSL